MILKFRFITFFGKFYSLKCAATSMNHSAFQWVEITILFQGRVLGWAGLEWDGNGLRWARIGRGTTMRDIVQETTLQYI